MRIIVFLSEKWEVKGEKGKFVTRLSVVSCELWVVSCELWVKNYKDYFNFFNLCSKKLTKSFSLQRFSIQFSAIKTNVFIPKNHSNWRCTAISLTQSLSHSSFLTLNPFLLTLHSSLFTPHSSQKKSSWKQLPFPF